MLKGHVAFIHHTFPYLAKTSMLAYLEHDSFLYSGNRKLRHRGNTGKNQRDHISWKKVRDYQNT